MRLADGTLWPMPVTLDVPEETAAELGAGASLALRDPEGVMLAALHISELYRPDREQEAKLVFGTTDKSHPGVAYLLDRSNPVYVSGRLEVVTAPAHYDYKSLRLTPAQLAGALRGPGLGEGRRVPDPQPDAPCPRRTDPAGSPPSSRPTS